MATPPTTYQERGFTIIEVIVAMFLLSVVVSGVAMAVVSGGRLEQTRDVNVRVQAAAERVYEHLRANKEWVDECRGSAKKKGGGKKKNVAVGDCDLVSHIEPDLLADDVLDVDAYDVEASAYGIDNPGDGVGKDDRDGVIDDFFRVSITVSLPAQHHARLGTASSRTLSSIINGSTNSESGSLVVQFCGAANQIDERLQLSSCSASVNWTDMPDCAGEPGCAPRSLFAGTPPPGLTTPTRFIGMVPLDVGNFRLRKRGQPENGMIVYASTAALHEATGRYRFSDLPTGTWEIENYSAGAGWVDWATHHIPSTRGVSGKNPMATVERLRTSNALVALQRPGASEAFQMRFQRRVGQRELGDITQTFSTQLFPECEQPRIVNNWNSIYTVKWSSCEGSQLTVHYDLNLASHICAMEGDGDTSTTGDGCNGGKTYFSKGHFRDFVDITYIGQTDFDWEVWDGAADDANFVIQPAPTGRVTTRKMTGDGAIYDIPVWSAPVQQATLAPHKDSDTKRDGIGSATIEGLPLGLHTPLMNTLDSGIANISTTWGPAGCDTRYTWVATDGDIEGGSCSSVVMLGQGECYTSLDSDSTNVWYKNQLGCGAIYWPPKKASMPAGYPIIRMCKRRVSYLTDIRVRYENYSTGVNSWMNYGDRTTQVHSTCEALPSKAEPLVCPQLDRWDNCSYVKVVAIPPTGAIAVTDGIDDGQRPATSGSSISTMSP